jgi:hypothetical protein
MTPSQFIKMSKSVLIRDPRNDYDNGFLLSPFPTQNIMNNVLQL